jgi:CopG family nickel-responsive transcriptional regulator
MRTLNVSLTDDLIIRIDKMITEKGYATKSEVVRDALRSYFAELDWELSLEGEILAVVAISFRTDRKGIFDVINLLAHRYEEIIATTVHHHLGRSCLEVVLARGAASMIRDFVEELRAVRGIESVRIIAA